LRAERGRHQRGALPGRDVCGGKLPVFLRDEIDYFVEVLVAACKR
jgi:hypothetical protein